MSNQLGFAASINDRDPVNVRPLLDPEDRQGLRDGFHRFLSPKRVRAVSSGINQAVADFNSEDIDTPIKGSLADWRAFFPNAIVANISGRRDLTDADFVHLRGIHTLNMRGCNQESITDAAFEHLRGIHTLNMDGCSQVTINDAAFEHLRGIHTLNMSRCNQLTITDAAFEHLEGIHTLYMVTCFQRTITDDAFKYLHGIKTLDMSHCNQHTITNGAFAHLRGIHALNMSYCNQDTITAKIFNKPGLGNKLEVLGIKGCSPKIISAATKNYGVTERSNIVTGPDAGCMGPSCVIAGGYKRRTRAKKNRSRRIVKKRTPR